MPKFFGDFGLIEITEGKPLSFHSCVNTGLMLPSYLLALMWQASVFNGGFRLADLPGGSCNKPYII
jgi:hypothetical protein